MTKAEKLLEELAQLDGDATGYENLWKECAELCYPERWQTFSTASNLPSASIRKYTAIALNAIGKVFDAITAPIRFFIGLVEGAISVVRTLINLLNALAH